MVKNFRYMIVVHGQTDGQTENTKPSDTNHQRRHNWFNSLIDNLIQKYFSHDNRHLWVSDGLKSGLYILTIS